MITAKQPSSTATSTRTAPGTCPRIPQQVRPRTPGRGDTIGAVNPPTCNRGGLAAGDLPKIGAPATRALASIGVTRLEDVAGQSETELIALHGFGPRALRILKEELPAE